MFHGNFYSSPLWGKSCGSVFDDALVVRDALNRHHSIQLGFQADSPYFWVSGRFFVISLSSEQISEW